MRYAGGHDEEKPDVGFLLACSSLLFAPTCHSLVFFTIGHHGRTGLGFGLLFWTPAVDWVKTTLESFSLLNTFLAWLQGVGMGGLKAFLIPMLVIVVLTPIVVVISLILVAVMMTPAMVSLVAERRFPELERKKGTHCLPALCGHSAQLWWPF